MCSTLLEDTFCHQRKVLILIYGWITCKFILNIKILKLFIYGYRSLEIFRGGLLFFNDGRNGQLGTELISTNLEVPISISFLDRANQRI